eukprot:gene41454-56082_t
MRALLKIILLISIFFANKNANSQSIEQQYIFRHLTEQNGLSYNIVNCFLKDRQGFLWFLKTTATAAAGFMIVPRHVLGKGFIPPSDKLLVGGIGVGGKGESDIWSFAQSGKAEIAFLCDVDEKRAAKSRERFPKAKFYKDFREMLSKEGKNMDAVSVSTPDHTHAIAALSAMQLGKHVYVQKPLTHDIFEARTLTQAADKYKVVTQMGNQGSSGDGVRKMMEWYNAGLIGEAHTIYCWTDRP